MAFVRLMGDADVLAVVLLREAVASEDRWIGEVDPNDRDRELARLGARLSDPHTGSFVADLDGDVIGFVRITEMRGLGELGMFVGRDHRGRGIGRELVDAAIAWARNAGCHKITLEVWPHNEAAIRLYESRGFVQEGRRVRHQRRRDGSLWDSVEMGLIIDSSSPGCPY